MTVVRYTRYYFPNGLRWAMLVLLLPSILYFLIVGWYIVASTSFITLGFLWTTKYETYIDLKKKVIKDSFYRFMIPTGRRILSKT